MIVLWSTANLSNSQPKSLLIILTKPSVTVKKVLWNWSQEFDEDLEDDVDKKDESEEKDDKDGSTGLFGLPNPFAKIQTNVKSLLNKIPLIG